MAAPNLSELKEKIQSIKTPEKMATLSLTKNEREKLSREVLLSWFRRKREKLKALQDEIRESTISERETMKSKIIENTRKELDKVKSLAEREKQRRAEEFAEAVISVGDEMVDLEAILKKYDRQEQEEKMFFGYLDHYVGKEKERNVLKNLFKTDLVKKLMSVLKKENPSAYYDIERAYKKGDYEEIKSLIAKASNGQISNETVDHVFAEAVLNTAGKKELLNVTSLSGFITLLDKLKTLGHGYAMRRTAKKPEFLLYLYLGLREVR